MTDTQASRSEVKRLCGFKSWFGDSLNTIWLNPKFTTTEAQQVGSKLLTIQTKIYWGQRQICVPQVHHLTILPTHPVSPVLIAELHLCGVCADDAGRVYVADGDNRRLLVLDAVSGAALRVLELLHHVTGPTWGVCWRRVQPRLIVRHGQLAALKTITSFQVRNREVTSRKTTAGPVQPPSEHCRRDAGV